MAVKNRNENQEVIISRDPRTCRFYASWLHLNKILDTTQVPIKDAESCRETLNYLITKHYPNKEYQAKLLSDMEIASDTNILSQEYFEWLRRDERAAFWLWAYLCNVKDYQLGINPPENAAPEKNWYQYLNLNISPESHQERIDVIIKFFDSIFIPAPPVSDLKNKIMEKLKNQWKFIYRKPLPLKWLPDEEEPVLWAWNQLSKIQKEKLSYIKYRASDRYSSPSESGLTTWLTPLSHHERNIALRVALDLWDDAPDSKRLFLLNLNKSWNQQKLRQSRTDKKALNTYLKNETKIRLDFMAEHNGVRISDMLETLINQHYQKMFGDE